MNSLDTIGAAQLLAAEGQRQIAQALVRAFLRLVRRLKGHASQTV